MTALGMAICLLAPSLALAQASAFPYSEDGTLTGSLDGARSVQIVDDNRDAYLYDLTVADPNSAAAQGLYIGTQVAGVKFDYAASVDGSSTPAVQQIELTYDDPSALSVVDINGERRVDVIGSSQTATLIDLTTTTANSVELATGVTAAAMTYQQTLDISGNTVQRLASIVLTVTNGSGTSTLTFDRGGLLLNAPSQLPQVSAAPQPPAAQMLLQKFQGSDAFQTLKSGFN
jgi:hypothetical protein